MPHDTAQVFAMAKKMGEHPAAAVAIRCRFLYDAMDTYLKDGSEVAMLWFWEAAEEAQYLLERAEFIARKKGIDTEIPLDVESARAYPIEELIDFTRGKATAWCHCDKTPSLTLDRKRNRAKCWPCDKSFDPIAVLMERDGMGFVQAVKFLTN